MSRIYLVLLSTALVIAIAGCSPAANDHSADGSKTEVTLALPTFDADNAYTLLKKQVDIGPRYPGSPGHEETARFIKTTLRSSADNITTDSFSEVVNGKTIQLQNIIAHFNPDAKKWVLLAAHWDTRPTADQEIDAEKRKSPILGADDGASGVAVLLELGRMFAQKAPDVGVVMVFFDGEDYTDSMFLGSKHFADNMEKLTRVSNKPISIEYGILLDMIGDSDLNIYQEEKSVEAAPDVVDKVWTTARRLGHRDAFPPRTKYAISDDHIPLIKAGLKCIDVIDFDYPYWHTLNDTSDKCSAESLKTVGNVISRVIYEEKCK